MTGGTAPANAPEADAGSRSAARPSGALTAERVSVHFEGLVALESVDLSLAQGSILGLIGPNGAGKTTLLNVLSGFQRPTTGTVRLGDEDITRWPPHRWARAGIGRTFQAVRLFPDMSVSENVELACVGTGLDRAAARAKAGELLDFFGLTPRADLKADTLPYGEERLIGVARALALDPAFVLMDEPAAGLSPSEARELLDRVKTVRDRFGCGVLIVDHNMQLIMDLCDEVQVLAEGRTIANGPTAEVRADESVRRAYLGMRAADAAPVDGAQADRAPVRADDAEPILAVEALTVDYGAVRAVSDVAIEVGDGELVAVIGPNGAGKSSLMSSIAGLVRPTGGAIRYRGQDIGGMRADRRVAEGIALVPEGRRVFPALTTEENLRTGLNGRAREDRRAQADDALLDRVAETFPALRERWRSPAGKLSGGEQQQLAIARALLSDPSLLLLDEPSLGLAPIVVDTVYDILKQLNRDGLSILLVEQNADKAMAVADHVYVLRRGRVELEGPTGAVRDDPGFERAYFGF